MTGSEKMAGKSAERRHKKWPQFFVLILCNMNTLSFGLQMGWLSPLQPSLQSENSPLGIPPLTTEQISWIGSLPSVSLILGTPFFGYCLNRFGRKRTCLLAAAPNLMHYLFLFFAKNVYLIYAARLIAGFCASGGFVSVPIYMNEISDANLKGFLGGLLGFIVKAGVIVSYVLGTYTSYMTLNIVSSLFTVFFLIFYAWLPESPVYLVAKNKREEAKASLRKLRGPYEKIIEKEMKQIENLVESEKATANFSYKSFFKTRITSRALFIVCGIYTIQMMCGYPAMVRYAVNILQVSSSAIPPDLGAIIVAVGQLLASLAGASLIDKLGRKSLLLISTFFMFVNLTVFSGYILTRSHFEGTEYEYPLRFIPGITLICFICGYALGYGSVPFVILPEIFAPEARAKGSTISNLWISFMEFVVVKIYPSLSIFIGLAPTLLIFATHCIFGLIFYHFVMIETKNLDFSDICNLLNGKPVEIEKTNSEMLEPLRYSNPEFIEKERD